MTLVDRSVRRQFTAAMALALALALVVGTGARAQTTASAVAAVAIDDSCNNVPEDGFPDVPETNTFDDEIECLKAYGITEGKGDGTYAPSGKVARWQMALFIYRLAVIADDQLDDFNLPTPSDQGFTDLGGVDPDAVDAINVLAELGVVEGIDADTYDPYTSINRAQMASFINRLQGAIQEALGGDPDGFTADDDYFPDDGGSVHEDNINALATVGIVQGKVTGKYNPGEKVNRGQMAAFIMRHVEVNVDNGVLESAYPPAAGPLGDLTDAPELQTVEIANTDEGSNEALLEFTFDEDVLGGGDPDDTAFHVIAPDDSVTNANSASRDGDDLTVVKAIFDLDAVEGATAAAVSTDAVTDVDDSLDNPEADFPLQDVDVTAGDTTRPDLIGVENIDPDLETADFIFDEDVVNPGGALNSAFHLILDDGDVLDGTAAAYTVDEDTVTVTFPDIVATDPDDTVRGDVEAGAVESDDSGNLNLDRTVDVNNDGNSDDPDLVSFALDTENDEVTFTFDETIVGGDANVDETLFELQEIDGNTETGATFEGSSGATVTVGFPSVSDSVVAVFVDADAVEDADSATGNDPDSATRGLSFDAGDTLAPNLVSAETSETKNISGDVTAVNVLYTFDEDVDEVIAGNFFAYDADGSAFELDAAGGDSCDVSDDDDAVVECEVTSDLEALDDTVLVTIVNNAVEDADDFQSHPENAAID